MRRRWVLISAVCAGVALLDRLSKHWAMSGAADGTALIPHIARAAATQNTGVAFGALSGGGWAVCALSAVMMIGIIIYLLRSPQASGVTVLALSLILAGGASNLFDRVRYGYVIDFIELTFVRFAVFNVADIAVVLGAIGLCVSLLRQGGER